MIIYCNKEIDKCIEDMRPEINYDTYIYSDIGIYKKYKHHYYQVNINNDNKIYKYNNNEYLVQENDNIMDKSKIITNIPYNHYIVKRKTMKTYINDNICWIHEVDNDVFTRDYFSTFIPIYEAFDDISLFYE